MSFVLLTLGASTTCKSTLQQLLPASQEPLCLIFLSFSALLHEHPDKLLKCHGLINTRRFDTWSYRRWMTFGFIMIKVSFNVSNNLCQTQKKGFQHFARNIMLLSTISEPPLGCEAAPATIKQMTQVFQGNYRSSVK